ncbi:MAG TPA: hypothetical protein VNF47_03625 [Streptosporangiaceae bacterium]|nr:hypothetical protein [Streptosporangiaceae bacterium]
MLALIGHDGDPVCDALLRAADRAGLRAARVRDPAAWKVTVQLDGDGRGRVDLRAPDGTPVTCAVNRSLPPQPGLGPGEYNDLLATWWAALALLPGRVVNRPSPQGFIPSPRLPGAYLTTRPRPCGTAVVANVHDAHTGRFLYRADGEHPSAQAPVLRVTPFDPGRAWRLMLAGDQAVELHTPADGLTQRDRAAGQADIRTFKAAGLGLALIVLSRAGDGVMRTVAVNPLPSLPHYQDYEERVHSALMGWLAG